MTAKDLSLGDWVYSSFSDKPCQVICITGYELEELLGYADVKTSGVVGAKDISSLSPIPLTAEILEKNNILYQWGYPWYQGIYDEEGIEVHFAEYCQMHLKYVHELQHALRLLHSDIDIKVL